MRARPARSHRFATAALWPIGIALTSWSYMWRTTPMHRLEATGSQATDAPPPLPSDLDADDVQHVERGVGTLYHRLYRVRIGGTQARPEEVVKRVQTSLNDAAPTEFARFFRVRGKGKSMQPGDEYVVRMPGPWDGPVRVVSVTPASFRFVTLAGHLEAGQIEFRAGRDQELVFEIESWARSGDRISNVLYGHLRMAKEVQLHMWVSFLERVARLTGGHRVGRIEIITRRLAA
jgi:hypothetical protein